MVAPSESRPWMDPAEVEVRRRAAKEFCDQPALVRLDWDALMDKHRQQVKAEAEG